MDLLSLRECFHVGIMLQERNVIFETIGILLSIICDASLNMYSLHRVLGSFESQSRCYVDCLLKSKGKQWTVMVSVP